jgi:hypothetical protein
MIIERAQVSKKVYLNEAYFFITSYIVIFTKVNMDFSMKYGLPKDIRTPHLFDNLYSIEKSIFMDKIIIKSTFLNHVF